MTLFINRGAKRCQSHSRPLHAVDREHVPWKAVTLCPYHHRSQNPPFWNLLIVFSQCSVEHCLTLTFLVALKYKKKNQHGGATYLKVHHTDTDSYL